MSEPRSHPDRFAELERRFLALDRRLGKHSAAGTIGLVALYEPDAFARVLDMMEDRLRRFGDVSCDRPRLHAVDGGAR